MVKDSDRTKFWIDYAKENDVVVYDFDGPLVKKEPVCLKVTKKMLIEKINDIATPFGHGYVVAELNRRNFVPNLCPRLPLILGTKVFLDQIWS